jgi:hypothetical protein
MLVMAVAGFLSLNDFCSLKNGVARKKKKV